MQRIMVPGVNIVHALYPALVKAGLHLTCGLHGNDVCAVRREVKEPPLACMRVPAVMFTNLTRGLTLAPQLCSMNAGTVEGQPLHCDPSRKDKILSYDIRTSH